jgi:2-iminobutanoate/2-iminopropanoate deaminase
MTDRTAIQSPNPKLNRTDLDRVPRSAGVRAGNLLFLSGMMSIDPATGGFRPGSVTEQTRTVLINLADLLQSAGTSLANAVKLTVNLASILDYEEMNAVYCDFFTGDSLPARTVCAVQMTDGQRIEVECVAVVPTA